MRRGRPDERAGLLPVAGPGVPYRALYRLRAVLEGKFDYRTDQLPTEHYRFWQLCKVVGPPDSWMDLPAEQLDWVLAIDGAVEQAKANVQEEASRG
ncbi:hypothetical protein ACWCP6_18085 [Streptomyces sp. NPDC002004]